MLLDSAAVSCDDVRELAESCGGVAIPAHIDRDANSMLRILGDVPEAYRVVELSTRATDDEREYWTQRKPFLRQATRTFWIPFPKWAKSNSASAPFPR